MSQDQFSRDQLPLALSPGPIQKSGKGPGVICAVSAVSFGVEEWISLLSFVFFCFFFLFVFFVYGKHHEQYHVQVPNSIKLI